MAAARAHNLLAWAHRGEGFANELSFMQVVRFKFALRKARDLLLRNADVASADPGYYAELLGSSLGAGLSPDKISGFLGEGVSRYPDYDELYFRTIAFSQPKWGGSIHEVAALADFAVANTESQRGYEMYARIYWGAGQAQDGKFFFQSPPASWDKMRQGINELVERYPDQWNINHLALFACVERDRELARRLVARVKEPILESAWHGRRNYEVCEAWLNK